MDTKTLMLTLAIFSILATISTKPCTQKFDCGDLKAPVCTFESLNATDSSVFYQMKPCSDITQLCPWANADPAKNPTINCTASTPASSTNYPGEPCTADIKCFGGNCTSGVCPGLAENAVCATHSACVVGLSCFNFTSVTNGTCRKQGAEGTVCVDDNDCVNTAGCNFDGKCKSYFSAKLGETVKYLPGDLSFCASGEASKSGNTSVCWNKLNVGNDTTFPCNDSTPCNYLNTADNITTPDSSACACSKGPNGNSYCPLGNGMPVYQDFVTAQKAYLQRTVDYKCHTLERTSCGLANRADTNTFANLYSKSIWARNTHILRDAPECVRKTMYPTLVQPTPPVNTTATCPKVKCDKLAKGTCANYTIDTTTNRGNFIGQSCDSANHCEVNIDIFNSTSTQSKSCVANPTDAIKNRYAGEKCDAKNDCVAPNTCTSNVCTGKAAAEVCVSDYDCKVGLYCKVGSSATNATNATNSTCTAQVKTNDACDNDYMCQNSQGCLNGKCTDLYSLALNSSIGNTTKLGGAFCKSNTISPTGTCYGLTYAAGMTANKDGLVPCNFTADPTPCSYTDTLGASYKEACQCSYDKNGMSYCRKEYKETDSNWNKLTSSLKNRVVSTKCHTRNRFNCYDLKDSVKTDSYNARIATVVAHNYFYADDCIKKLFNAGEFIKMSFVILAALVINLL
jgi:hypothetical protein